MSQPLLHIKDFSVQFVTERETTTAVNKISLTVNRGEIVALVGESGSGKSVTSLSILQLLPSPPASFSGQLLFTFAEETVDLLKLSPKALQEVRGNQIAMIFQEPMTSLNPVMRCGIQVMEALLHHKKSIGKEAKQKTIEWFAKVKLPDPEGVFDKYPHQLSGGQKQRVMIAMAMCCEPALLICDEPTTALDVTVQKTVLELIKDLQREQNMGVIFITHDLSVVAEIADRVAILYKGELLEQNTAADLFKSPQHPYTQALLACRPALHPKGQRLPVVADYLEGTREKAQEDKEEISNAQSSRLKVQGKEQGPRNKEGATRNEPNEKQETRNNSVLVDIQKLSVRFPTKTNLLGKHTAYFTAVDEVSLQIHKGETLGLVGESGCGKTTLGRTLLRLIEPSSGHIITNGVNITTLSGNSTKALRKDVQLVFQDPYSSLNPRLTIGDAIAEPMQVHGITTAKERRTRVADLLDKVGLPAAYSRRYPHQFSGGQRQRIVIARALALNPTLIVCDESVSALDVSVQAQVLNLLNDIKGELGLTMLFISHDLSVVRYMSDRIAVMQKGRIVELGEAEQVYSQPVSPYTQTLLRAIPKITIP
ncbi:MAG: transporter ATP-binding protein [Flaviaesturariibacter sp.]|nr:transporter ATP-binding protein [Flaviaesturariibacter sp.]